MPDLNPGIGVFNDDCDALASHARNGLQSDRDDPCHDSRRHFPFIGPAVTIHRLRLPDAVGLK